MEKKIKGLYAIVDDSFSCGRSHLELASSYLVGGCRLMQLRVKKTSSSLWDEDVFSLATKIMEFKKTYPFTFIINDYVDVAAEVGADGVHVGSNDMPVEKIRQRIGSRFLIGYSSHSIEEAVDAERRGADYVAFGAIYPSKIKGPNHPVQGTQKLSDLVSMLSVPVVAIGGINRLNIDEVLSTKVASVAMITALTEAKDIVDETRWYVERMR